MKYIDYKDINNDYLLIDVRTKEEYLNSHFNGFINIPLSNILNGIRPFSKDRKIVLYCDYGRRSLMGARILNSIGYLNIYILKVK